MGNMKTRSFGVNTVSVPPRAKMAPEAPITGEDVNSRQKMLPIIPPRKYMIKKFLVPISLVEKLPKK